MLRNGTIDMAEILLFWVVCYLLHKLFLDILKKLDGVVVQVVIYMIVLFSEIAWVELEHNMMKKKMIKKH